MFTAVFTISPFTFRICFVAGTRVCRQKLSTDNQLHNSQKDPEFCAFRVVLSQFLPQKCNEFSS